MKRRRLLFSADGRSIRGRLRGGIVDQRVDAVDGQVRLGDGLVRVGVLDFLVLFFGHEKLLGLPSWAGCLSFSANRVPLSGGPFVG